MEQSQAIKVTTAPELNTGNCNDETIKRVSMHSQKYEASLYMKLFHLSLVSVSFSFHFYSLLCYGEHMSEAGL